MVRRNSLGVIAGNLKIGDSAPISIQSMTNTDTRNVEETIDQVNRLEEVGCDIVRMAFFDSECVNRINEYKKYINIPIVADIHFDYRLALSCIEKGIDKVRINPGNIGGRDRVKKVADAAKLSKVPIRIGVNGGSLPQNIIEKYGVTSEGIVECAVEQIKMLEDFSFNDIVISLKASNVHKTIEANRMIAKRIEYPLHLGVTEAGSLRTGTVKSAIGIGTLLMEGIGDTIRVSLSDSPIHEVKVAKDILRSIGLRKEGIEIISCPTCGRCNIDLFKIVSELEERLSYIDKSLKVAVMGCVVNGPGEAKEADIGIAGGKGKFSLFKKGKIVGTYNEKQAVELLVKEIENA